MRVPPCSLVLCSSDVILGRKREPTQPLLSEVLAVTYLIVCLSLPLFT